MNEQELGKLMGQMLGDIGGAFSIPLVRIGVQLGLYEHLAGSGPCTPAELASAKGLAERYVREWLCSQAAANYVTYDAESSAFSMSEEQAAVLADPESPHYLAPSFDSAAAALDNHPLVQQAFATGGGVDWGEQSECLACAVAKFFRPGYKHNLVQHWLPALDGVVDRLEAGVEVADVGCGHGISTMIMAEAFPNSRFVGVDFHGPSIDAARQHAADAALPNLRFETSMAASVSGRYGLITMFDCLHDMGDPVGAMRSLRASLAEDGACMIVEPMAGDAVQDNLNPVGRLFYAASTMVCVPTSLAQEVGAALGAQAGEAELRRVVVDEAGFSSLRRAAETPFNLILEARP